MNIIGHIKSFLFPYEEELKAIRENNLDQIAIAVDNTRRIESMMATLNGEDGWMLKRVKEDHADGNHV